MNDVPALADRVARTRSRLDAHGRMAVPFDLMETHPAPGLLDNRAGGPLAWPARTPLPLDAEGQPMVQLLQVRLQDLAPLPGFPRDGLLQLFLSANMDAAILAADDTDTDLVQPRGFRLVHHPDPSQLVTTPAPAPEVDYPIVDEHWFTTARKLALFDPVPTPAPQFNIHNRDLEAEIAQWPELVSRQVSLFEVEEALWDPIRMEAPGFMFGGFAAPLQVDQRTEWKGAANHLRCIIGFGDHHEWMLEGLSMAVVMRDADLAAARWDRALLIMDSD
ncbi:DUF1963 domain-containing protein [Mameliella alba]|nr:DUF1963 domain-containing protein [Antarctobacter heliothermus]MBY6145597.1 DUF1963 domain-containing protein [Mameliella alba]MCA0955605.1 DUF1963 domain-containing protein [Mameliella alba]